MLRARSPLVPRAATALAVTLMLESACGGVGVSEDPFARPTNGPGGSAGAMSGSGGAAAAPAAGTGASRACSGGGIADDAGGGNCGQVSAGGAGGDSDAGGRGGGTPHETTGGGGDAGDAGASAGGVGGARVGPVGGGGATGHAGALSGGAGGSRVAEGGAGAAGEAGNASAPIDPVNLGERRCAHDAPFLPPVRVEGLPPSAVRLRLSPDERVGYFARLSSTSDYDILVATRETRHEAFVVGEPLPANGVSWDFSPAPTGDASILFLESQDSGIWKIYESHWNPKVAAFGTVALAPGLREDTATYTDGGPYITPNGEAIYFHSTRFGDGNRLALARRVGATFGAVQHLNLGLAHGQSFPVVSSDELTLYFALTHSDDGQVDIWSASRRSTSEKFASFRKLEGVNTEANEVPSYISEDGCRLYFDRNTGLPFAWGRPDDAVYVAERIPDE